VPAEEAPVIRFRWSLLLASAATVLGPSCGTPEAGEMAELESAVARQLTALSPLTRAGLLNVDDERMIWVPCSGNPEFAALSDDLDTRGECPGASSLRHWFEARGVSHSFEMERVVWTALWRRIRGMPEDLAGLLKVARTECLRRYGPAVRLPVIEHIEFDYADGPGAFHRIRHITVDAQGRCWMMEKPVAGASLREALWIAAEEEADLVLRCHRDAPWSAVSPIIRAILLLEPSPNGFALAVVEGTWDHERYLLCYPPSGLQERRDFRFGASKDSRPCRDDVLRIPSSPDVTKVSARIVVDATVRMGDLAQWVHDLNCRNIWHIEFADSPEVGGPR
jgi:hypothetical protein